MKTLIKNAEMIYTFDPSLTEYKSGCIIINGKEIEYVGELNPELENSIQKDNIIDASGKVVLPGLINTHHHFYQNVTRNISLVQKCNLLDWLMYLYTVWAEIDEEAIYEASRVAIGELLLTGCTTTVDFSYIYPKNKPYILEYVIKAANEMGIRMHAFRGCMPVMEADLSIKLRDTYNLKIEDLIEEKDRILTICNDFFTKYHDSEPFSMMRIGTGPTTVLFQDADFMNEIKNLANKYNALCHTHLHPRADENTLCKELYNSTPLEFMEDIGWLDRKTFLAHATRFSSNDIKIVARNNTSITHSPSCHMRLGYPVAPVPDMINSGVNVGIGVDGGASNDSGNMLGELRTTMYVHRIEGVHDHFACDEWFGPYDVFKMATHNGAKLLNRNDIGSLEVGKAADLIMYDINKIPYAGGISDLLGALVYCGSSAIVDTSIINGKVVVKNNKLVNADEEKIVEQANHISMKLLNQAERKTGLKYY